MKYAMMHMLYTHKHTHTRSVESSPAIAYYRYIGSSERYPFETHGQ